ncbi:hypothetical protein IGI04_037199 [Brassica rapa subsp. trilocularis]|uniref:Uncharacterized protein n=1 Tax=Brassica rapa subsp. trilocularis TaxID=1813537 RepID=A0ABQ7LGN3_BRACM|nr:hypothetical protein IGI04_037199 [Brassica rapa subsp. trilocularis]
MKIIGDALTVGFNMRKVAEGNVTIKLWDLGVQPRFLSMWERYCRSVAAIVMKQDLVSPTGLIKSCLCISDVDCILFISIAIFDNTKTKLAQP